MSNKTVTISLIVDGKRYDTKLDAAEERMGKFGDTARRTSGDISHLSGVTRVFGGVIAGLSLAELTKQSLLAADSAKALDARVRLASEGLGEFEDTNARIFALSQQNRTALETTVDLYQTLGRSAPELNATNDQVLQMVDLVQKLGLVSGSSKTAMSAGLLQFGQAMSAGVVRAEEMNSILENLPALAGAIADGMGLTVGGLRNAVLEGKVLSEDVFAAILSQQSEINRQAEEMPVRLEQGMTQVGNSFTKAMGQLDSELGATEAIADTLTEIAETIDDADMQDFADGLQATAVAAAAFVGYSSIVPLINGIASGLMLLTGPAGLLALAAGGLYYLATSEDDTEKSTREVTNALRDLQTATAENIPEVKSLAEQQLEAAKAALAMAQANADASWSQMIFGQASGVQLERIQQLKIAIENLKNEIASTESDVADQALINEIVGRTPRTSTTSNSSNTSNKQSIQQGPFSDLFTEHLKSRNEYLAYLKHLDRIGSQVYEKTRTSEEQLALELEGLDTLLKNGAISWDTYSRATMDAWDSVEDVAKSNVETAETLLKDIKDGIEGFASDLSSAFADFALDAENSFDRVAEAFARMILEMAFQQLIAQPLVDGISGALSLGTTKSSNSQAATKSAPGYAPFNNQGVVGRSFDSGNTGVPMSINIINNSSQPVSSSNVNTRMDAKGMVTDIVLNDLATGGRIDRELSGRGAGRKM